MDHLQQELDRLLAELEELNRCSKDCDEDAGNVGLMTLARRGTKLEIAEVRALMAQKATAG